MRPRQLPPRRHRMQAATGAGAEAVDAEVKALSCSLHRTCYNTNSSCNSSSNNSSMHLCSITRCPRHFPKVGVTAAEGQRRLAKQENGSVGAVPKAQTVSAAIDDEQKNKRLSRPQHLHPGNLDLVQRLRVRQRHRPQRRPQPPRLRRAHPQRRMMHPRRRAKVPCPVPHRRRRPLSLERTMSTMATGPRARAAHRLDGVAMAPQQAAQRQKQRRSAVERKRRRL